MILHQIGGFTLIGINYEIMLNDPLGIHFGGGHAGFTFGLQSHTNGDKDSSYFNLNFKDGGFGLINTAGVEYGSKLRFSQKNDFGILTQFGIGAITGIDDSFET